MHVRCRSGSLRIARQSSSRSSTSSCRSGGRRGAGVSRRSTTHRRRRLFHRLTTTRRRYGQIAASGSSGSRFAARTNASWARSSAVSLFRSVTPRVVPVARASPRRRSAATARSCAHSESRASARDSSSPVDAWVSRKVVTAGKVDRKSGPGKRVTHRRPSVRGSSRAINIRL